MWSNKINQYARYFFVVSVAFFCNHAISEDSGSDSSLTEDCNKYVERILTLMGDDFWVWRQAGIRGVAKIQSECVPLVYADLVGMLDDESSIVRREAVRTLDSIGLDDDALVEKIADLATDESGRVRVVVAKALGNLAHSTPHSLESLASLFESGHVMERDQARRSLLHMGADSFPIFVRNVRNDDLAVSDWSIMSLREMMPLSAAYLRGCIKYCENEDEKKFLKSLLETIQKDDGFLDD